MDAFVTTPGFEAALREELRAAGLQVDEPPGRPGLVVVTAGEGAQAQDPVFALQALPAVTTARGDSVASLAKAAFDLLADPLDACDHWTLHAYPLPTADRSLDRRAALVGAALVDLVRRHRRRTSRRLLPVEALTAEQARDPSMTVAQVTLAERDEALVSAARLAPALDARWPGGVPEVEEDRGAPSSAYRKAEEAYLRLGLAPAPGERVVDLGGSPGGWTWTALKRGARVLAVDRAPLAPPAHGHPLLEERLGDAFRFEPDDARDWLLCDVIAAPERTLEVLDRWLERRWCRRFVVNVKFKGTERLPALTALRALLARRGARARVKHLVHDKNEVTVFGVAAV